MKLVILLLVLPCFVRASKEQCSNGTQSCLIDGTQTCCDTQFFEDADSIKPFYTAAKESQYFNDSSTNASSNVQHGFWCNLMCSGKCCPNDVCCPFQNGVCCPEKGCCEKGYQCCGGGCCKASNTCCNQHKVCCYPGYSCCANQKGCCPYGSECCGKYCCPNGAECFFGSCFGAAGISNPTVSVLIAMFVLSLKMRLN